MTDLSRLLRTMRPNISEGTQYEQATDIIDTVQEIEEDAAYYLQSPLNRGDYFEQSEFRNWLHNSIVSLASCLSRCDLELTVETFLTSIDAYHEIMGILDEWKTRYDAPKNDAFLGDLDDHPF